MSDVSATDPADRAARLPAAAREVLDFWFADAAHDPARAGARMGWWFGGAPETDAVIRERFGDRLAQAARGELDDWAGSAHGALALILVLDQFPRNVHRGEPGAFACDAQALRIARQLFAGGAHAQLSPVEQIFAAMPWQHAEDLATQRESLQVFGDLVAAMPTPWRGLGEGVLKYARLHHDIVARFGRYPHRNAILGRADTPEEAAWLADDAPTFGQGG